MDVINVLNIILYKTYAELKQEVSRSYLGLLWWIIEPIIYMLTFYYVFEVLMHRGGDDFIVYLIIGLVAWKWFGSSVQSASFSIYSHKGLIQRIYIPKIIFPLSVICANTFKFLIVFFILLLFVTISGYAPNVTWLLLPFIILVQLILIISLGLFFSSLVPFLPDLKFLIDNGFTMLMFVSGVFFNIGTLPENIQNILYLNPVAVLITIYRDILMHNDITNISLLYNVMVFAVFIMIIAVLIQYKFNRIYPRLIK